MVAFEMVEMTFSERVASVMVEMAVFEMIAFERVGMIVYTTSLTILESQNIHCQHVPNMKDHGTHHIPLVPCLYPSSLLLCF